MDPDEGKAVFRARDNVVKIPPIWKFELLCHRDLMCLAVLSCEVVEVTSWYCPRCSRGSGYIRVAPLFFYVQPQFSASGDALNIDSSFDSNPHEKGSVTVIEGTPAKEVAVT